LQNYRNLVVSKYKQTTMFKENRIIFYNNTTTSSSGNQSSGASDQSGIVAANTNTEQPTDKIQELKTSLAGVELSDTLRALAINALESGDEDEIALVEKLIAKKVKAKKFEAKLVNIQDTNRGVDVDNLQDISDKITSRTTSISQLQGSIPEDAVTKNNFAELFSSMNGVIERERINISSIMTALSPYVLQGKITSVYANRIANFDPESPDFEDYLEKYLGPELSADKKLVEKLVKLKNAHREITTEYESVFDKAQEAVDKLSQGYEAKKNEYYTLQHLSKISGVTVKAGTKLEYKPKDSLDFVTAEIKKVEFIQQPSESALTENNNELVQKIVITVRDENSGAPVTRELTQRDFVIWINQNQVSESIQTLDELEDKMDFKGYGQKFTEGTIFDFISKRVTGTGAPVYDKAKIKKIDHTNRTIELDKSVIVSDLEMLHEDSYTPDTQTKLTFGEFFNWYKKRSATPSVDLSSVRQIIQKAPTVYTQRYKNIPEPFEPINQSPIQINQGEKLTWGDSKTATISVVEPNKIILDNGLEYTPSQFLSFVKENEVERAKEQSSIPEAQNTNKAVQPTDAEIQSAKEMLANLKANGQTELSIELPTEESEKDKMDSDKDKPMPYEKKGALAKLWGDTHVMSWSDISKFFTTVMDFFKGRQEGISTRRAALIGKTMPGALGVTFKNQFQSRENDAVSAIQGGLENQGVDDWYNELVACGPNTDIIKATTNLLCKSGNFDFEDKKIWSVWNEAFKDNVDEDEYNANCINENGGKNKSGKPPVKALMYIMDKVYGKPSGISWFNENKSSYTSQMNNLAEEAKEKGAEVMGVENELNNMLRDHKENKFVSGSRFEAYIRFMIQYGLCEASDKIFYIIAGLTVPNENGAYLLSRARVGSLDASLMSNFPILNFFSDFKPYKEIKGHPEQQEVLPRSYFEKVVDNFEYTGELTSKSKPYNQKAVNNFIQEVMMQNKRVRERASLASRGADQSTDHDDTPYSIPILNTTGILQILGYTRGDIPMLTEKGHANGLAGMNEHLKVAAHASALPEKVLELRKKNNFEDPATIIQTLLKSYLIYESNLAGRVHMGKYMKLDNSRFQTPAAIYGGDGMPLSQSALEVKNLLAKILHKYAALNNGSPSAEDINFMLFSKQGEGQPESDRMKKLISGFSDVFDRLIQTYGSDIMVETVQEAVAKKELTGFGGKPNKDLKPLIVPVAPRAVNTNQEQPNNQNRKAA